MMNGKRVGMGVHTAVARAFVDGYSIGLQVSHKDGDKKNNNANNLEWVTPLENVKHSREVLGFDNREEHNPQAKAVTAFDYKTGKCMYHFNSVMSAARYFSPNDENKARHIQSIISGIACGYGTKKTYHCCIWRYL